MDDRIIQFRVGVLVLATLFIGGLLVFIVGGYVPSFAVPTKTVYVRFPQAPGVSVDTPVRKSGILIGRVSNVALLDDGTVLVTLKLHADRKVFENETVRIGTSNILGDAVLEFVPGSQPVSTLEVLEDEAYMEGRVAANPLDIIEQLTPDIQRALDSLAAAGDDISFVAREVQGVVGDNRDRVERILRRTESALIAIEKTSETANELLGDEELAAKLKQALDDVPELTKAAKATLAEAQDALGDFRSATQAAERNLRNLEGFSKPLGDRGEAIAKNVDEISANVNELVVGARGAVDNLDRLLIDVRALSGGLGEGDGTIAKLLNDPELYHRLLQTVTTVEKLTRELRPIVADIRVFTDKIARDPGRIGVKGALDRRATGPK